MKNTYKSPAGILGIFLVLFVVHLAVSFAAWTFAPGNVVPHAKNDYTVAQRVAWPLFSFPLFYLVPDRTATTSFELLLVVNSLVVALVLVILAWLGRNRVVRASG